MCYRARFDKFGRVAAAITGSDDAALDAVQEAFARAVRERETFRRDGPIEAWLWRIVVNTARNARAGEREEAPLTTQIRGARERPNR